MMRIEFEQLGEREAPAGILEHLSVSVVLAPIQFAVAGGIEFSLVIENPLAEDASSREL